MTEREIYTEELSDKETGRAQEINNLIRTTEKLITQFNLSEENEPVLNKLVRDLSRMRSDYESIYIEKVKKNSWEIFPEFKWYIDFENKKLKIVEFMKD